MNYRNKSTSDLIVLGKVKLHHEKNQQQSFVSACVLVFGNVRNLFALPKDGDNDMVSTQYGLHTVEARFTTFAPAQTCGCVAACAQSPAYS